MPQTSVEAVDLDALHADIDAYLEEHKPTPEACEALSKKGGEKSAGAYDGGSEPIGYP